MNATAANPVAGDRSAHSNPPLGKIDRFLVPAGDPRVAAFVVDHLYVAHNLRERLAWEWHRLVGRGAVVDRATARDLTAASLAAVEAATRMASSERRMSSWIVDTDYRESARGRSLIFLFREDGRYPAVVIKHQPAAAANGFRSLARERAALEELHRALPSRLAGTVPSVIGHDVADGYETLALTWLAGRSAYVEMHTRLRPSADLKGHFEAAASWLAAFHDATALGGQTIEPWCSETDDARDGAAADRLRRLRETCARTPIAAVRTHGDFWARNVLLVRQGGDPRIGGVVDWERSAAGGSPFEDLFQFALTYGLNYPFSRYRRAGAVDAFRATFIAENRVSRGVRAYLREYCRRRGLDAVFLREWFRCFLRERASRDVSTGDAWLRFNEMIGAADRSVFSG